MKKIIVAIALTMGLATAGPTALAQHDTTTTPPLTEMTAADSLMMGSAEGGELLSPEDMVGEDMAAGLPLGENMMGLGLHDQLKSKFVEGSAGFMSLVALTLVLGLALCIERIIYLTLAEVNNRRLMADIEKKVEEGDVEGAKTLCRETRGPVASICYQGLLRMKESMDSIERSIQSYGSVQLAKLEKGCSWITLCIAIAPSLGFLGTVIGMVMAFDQIEFAGDISPKIVAGGMKVALITTIFGIIVALILQLFYNYILSKIDHLTAQMEESAISLMDILGKVKSEK
jgi:biopolymer transport protein ExbB